MSDYEYRPYGEGFRCFSGERLVGSLLPISYAVHGPTGNWLRNTHGLDNAKQILETTDAENIARIAAEGK